MAAGHRTADLLHRDVRLGGVTLGVVADALLDEGTTRLVGLDVRCGDRTHRFLPLPACALSDGHLEVDSALVLLERELDFYRRRGRSLSSLYGVPVRRGRELLGRLADLSVGPDGGVAGIAVETDDGTVIEVDPAGVHVGLDSLPRAV